MFTKTHHALTLGLALLYAGSSITPVLASEPDLTFIEEADGNNGGAVKPGGGNKPTQPGNTGSNSGSTGSGTSTAPAQEKLTVLYADRNEYRPGEKAFIILVCDPSKDDGQSPKWQMTSKKLDSGESGLLTDENVFKEETAQMTEGKSSKYVEVTSDEPALVSVSCTYKGTKYSFELTFKEDAKSNTTNSDKKGNEVPMLRLYNPNSGEHFYTEDKVETINLIGAGWIYEGVGWIGSSTGDSVYRLYNPNSGDHHYTMDEDEKDGLVSLGWKYEGVGWKSSTSSKAVPVYRQYNPNAKTGSHNYTTSASEAQYLVSVGWKDEGTGWKALR